MGFFDSLIDTPTYQAQNAATPPMSGGLPMMPPTGMAKGGLASANQQIKDVQILKVIANYFQNQGMPIAKAMEGVKKELENGLELIPFESSVMGVKILGKGVAQVHFFTVGTLKDLANDMQYFYKYLKNKGINTIYDSVPAPITAQIFEQLGAKMMESDKSKYKYKASI